MDQNIPTVKTVRVLLVNLDDRQFAIFRMAFKMHNTTDYQLVREDDRVEPELVLVDGDARGGTAQWQAAKQKFPNARVIYFATQPPTFTAPHLAKPIKFDTLFANLRNLLQGNGIWVTGKAEPMVTPAPNAMSGHVPVGQNDHNVHMHDEPGVMQTAAKEKGRQESVAIRSFSTAATLLGLVQQLLQQEQEQEQDTAVAVDGKPVLVIFPTIQRVLLAAEPERIQALCEQTNLQLETKAVPAGAQLHEKAKIKSEAFVWQLAIWTAQGRLIEPITPDTILKLKSWPNMTRMAFLPESMRLSAFLIKTPVSLSMLYKLLPLEMGDILNFIAATYVAGYLQIEQPLEQKLQRHEAETVLSRPVSAVETSASPTADDDEPGKQPRGLLQRLMSRLRVK